MGRHWAPKATFSHSEKSLDTLNRACYNRRMYRAMEGVGSVPVRSVPLPGGEAGTRKTVAAMQRLAVEGSRDPVVRQAVIGVLQRSAAPHDVPAQAAAWFRYVKNGIYFLHDPANTEWLQSARVTLQCGAGDCDDRAILLAAGLKSFGVPTQFKIVAADPQRPNTFSHVYLESFLNNRWVAMDPTYTQNTLGDEPAQRFRTWTVPA